MRFNLSEVRDLIRDRRTIYPIQFSDREIHKEIIEELLNNAIWAPTHGKSQPWRFKVYQKKSRNILGELLLKEYRIHIKEEDRVKAKELKMVQRPLLSSTIIAVWMERPKAERISEIDELMACACAIQNILLSATAHGIGSFLSTPNFIHSEGFRQRYGLKEKDRMLGFVYLGYPKGDWPKGQRKPIEYITEWVE